MKIEFLSDYPDTISQLVSWYISQWDPYYGVAGPGDARADLEARLNRDKLPIGLVATEAGKVVATVALDLDATTHLSPSITGLLVGQNHRGKGIGTALIKSCVGIARDLGYGRIYISTNVLDNLLVRMGWQKVGEARFLNEARGRVYVHEIQSS